MAKISLRPLSDKIVVQRLEAEVRRDGGIWFQKVQHPLGLHRFEESVGAIDAVRRPSPEVDGA